MVDVLADLHAVDINSSGLATFGKPVGFVQRQVRGWTKRWHDSQTTELREMDALASWLLERLPFDPARPTLVHGDFKLDNVMLDSSDLGRLIAVFDWEMSAIGDPLVDLGILLAYWLHTATLSQHDTLTPVTNRAGWFTRAELLERYGVRSGLDLANIAFYEVFAVFKLAVVLQQIFYRYHRGQTDDPRFATLDSRVRWLALVAIALAENGSN
jgi:aminoglycoside phosphotransferase (APT) family kinase protein